jgi:hypothetical protein
MKYTYRTFSGVASTFEVETAGQIAERTKSAVDERDYASKASYQKFITAIHDLESRLIEELDGEVTDETMSRYEEAIDRPTVPVDVVSISALDAEPRRYRPVVRQVPGRKLPDPQIEGIPRLELLVVQSPASIPGSVRAHPPAPLRWTSTTGRHTSTRSPSPFVTRRS